MDSPTALSPQTSPLSPTSTAEYPDHIAPWDENLEARLQYNREQLKASQKRWSQGQELWLGEVERLTAMKKRHLKDIKRWQVQQNEQTEAVQAKKWFGLWKKKTLKEPPKGQTMDDSALSKSPQSPVPTEPPRRMSFGMALRRMSTSGKKG